MHDKDDKEDTWQIDNWKIGLGGTLTLATTAACAALLFCLLRRGATCCRPDRPPPQVNVPLSVNLQGIEKKNYVKSGSKYKAKTKIVKSFIKKGDKSQTKIRLKTQIHEIQKYRLLFGTAVK